MAIKGEKAGLVAVYAAVTVALSLLLFVIVVAHADTFVRSYGLNRRFYGSATVYVSGILLMVAGLAIPARLQRVYRRASARRPAAAVARVRLTVSFLGIAGVQCALVALLAAARILIFTPLIGVAEDIPAGQIVQTFLPPPFGIAAVAGAGLAAACGVARVVVARRLLDVTAPE